MKKYNVILVGLLIWSMCHGLAYAESGIGEAIETAVESSEIGTVIYFNGADEGAHFKASRTPFLTIGEEFPVDISLVLVDKPLGIDGAASVSMEILDAVNLLAKAVDQKIEYKQSKRFSFGVGVDINKKLLEFKPDVLGYATYQLFKFDI